MEMQDTPTPRKSRSPYIIGGIVVLVLLFAGAAFVGGRLLNGQGLSGLPGLFSGGDGGRKSQVILDDIQPAKELPQTPADVRGIFDHRQDNSIFVGTGRVMMNVKKDQSGKVETSSNHDGSTVEVVITSKTVVYQDVTMNQFDGPPPQGQKIQQVVELGSPDEIGKSSFITVWGRKTGDRFIADILVYTPPAFIK